MIKSIIVAKSKNNIIGKKNYIQWNIKKDLEKFKEITMGKYIIIGRKTFESIKNILTGRKIIILTNKKEYKSKYIIKNNINKALNSIKKEKEVFIVGGEKIYNRTIKMINKIYVTNIKYKFKGKIFFPIIKKNEWIIIKKKIYKKKYNYKFIELFKINQKYFN